MPTPPLLIRPSATAARRPRSRALRGLACLAAAGALLLSAAAGAGAATVTFGSPLSVPATLNTATDLGYAGAGIPTILNEKSVVYHVNHDGADTALWNTALASGSPTAPASGQIVSVSLEGCAEPAPGGPPPLTQVHFQDLTPQAGGGAQANVTTQPFEIPVCGVGGADGSTVSTYQPTNFCVSQGDYVDFNDEGGFAPEDPLAYPSGVPYQVIGSVQGSSMDSFIDNNGTGNGAVFSPGVTTYHNGFVANDNKELMLQATLATGPDATPLCPGGTKGEGSTGPPAPSSGGSSHSKLPTVTVPKQDDGVNRRGLVEIALYCHAASTCTGTLAIRLTPRQGAHAAAIGESAFSVPSLHTAKVTVHLSSAVQRLLHRLAGQLTVKVTVLAAPAARPWTESIGLRGWRAG
jgi:hypothetical protein